jgi:hypothetical protein
VKQQSQRNTTSQINRIIPKKERSNKKVPNKAGEKVISKGTRPPKEQKIADIGHGRTEMRGPANPLRSLKPLTRHSIRLQRHPDYNGWYLCAEFDCDGDNGGPSRLDNDDFYASIPEALGAAAAWLTDRAYGLGVMAECDDDENEDEE